MEVVENFMDFGGNGVDILSMPLMEFQADIHEHPPRYNIVLCSSTSGTILTQYEQKQMACPYPLLRCTLRYLYLRTVFILD